MAFKNKTGIELHKNKKLKTHDLPIVTVEWKKDIPHSLVREKYKTIVEGLSKR